MDSLKFIFQTNGLYMGYVDNNYLYTRDGQYLGWVENDGNVYDNFGRYRGRLFEISGNYYILKNRFILDPLPKPTSPAQPPHQPVPPRQAVSPVVPNMGMMDAFKVWGVS